MNPGELFPVEVKGLASSICTAVNWCALPAGGPGGECGGNRWGLGGAERLLASDGATSARRAHAAAHPPDRARLHGVGSWRSSSRRPSARSRRSTAGRRRAWAASSPRSEPARGGEAALAFPIVTRVCMALLIRLVPPRAVCQRLLRRPHLHLHLHPGDQGQGAPRDPGTM